MNIKKKPSQRFLIIAEFAKLGFRGQTSFCKVCTSMDVSLVGLDLIQFWSLGNSNPVLNSRLEAILENLKNE